MMYFRRYLSHRVNEVIDACGCEPPFLEVGCGTGTALEWLTERFGRGVGIEVSREAIALAEKLVADKRLNVTLLKESLFEHHGEYNTVLAIDVLEHFPDNVAALRHMGNLLSPKGKLILLVPSGPYMDDDIMFGHSTRYSVASLCCCLHEAGLRPVALSGFGFPALTLLRLLKNKFHFTMPPTSRAQLIENSLRSSYTNPFVNTWLDRVYKALEKWRAGQRVIDALLHLELRGRVWASFAHSILCVAERNRG